MAADVESMGIPDQPSEATVTLLNLFEDYQKELKGMQLSIQFEPKARVEKALRAKIEQIKKEQNLLSESLAKVCEVESITDGKDAVLRVIELQKASSSEALFGLADKGAAIKAKIASAIDSLLSKLKNPESLQPPADDSVKSATSDLLGKNGIYNFRNAEQSSQVGWKEGAKQNLELQMEKTSCTILESELTNEQKNDQNFQEYKRIKSIADQKSTQITDSNILQITSLYREARQKLEQITSPVQVAQVLETEDKVGQGNEAYLAAFTKAEGTPYGKVFKNSAEYKKLYGTGADPDSKDFAAAVAKLQQLEKQYSELKATVPTRINDAINQFKQYVEQNRVTTQSSESDALLIKNITDYLNANVLSAEQKQMLSAISYETSFDHSEKFYRGGNFRFKYATTVNVAFVEGKPQITLNTYSNKPAGLTEPTKNEQEKNLLPMEEVALRMTTEEKAEYKRLYDVSKEVSKVTRDLLNQLDKQRNLVVQKSQDAEQTYMTGTGISLLATSAGAFAVAAPVATFTNLKTAVDSYNASDAQKKAELLEPLATQAEKVSDEAYLAFANYRTSMRKKYSSTAAQA